MNMNPTLQLRSYRTAKFSFGHILYQDVLDLLGTFSSKPWLTLNLWTEIQVDKRKMHWLQIMTSLPKVISFFVPCSWYLLHKWNSYVDLSLIAFSQWCRFILCKYGSLFILYLCIMLKCLYLIWLINCDLWFLF